ncbi:hypothetical protein Trco_008229 [Trichoderma cornu-damae]|uniref:Uncharacterized protein n=1 Tax=Trichoderma cornu-damae TaxID=654480 RepID=A0A9P8TSM3_9HYPO|nr:hypothetical protein Trco_008229 [Trichoderma cornu-damae]
MKSVLVTRSKAPLGSVPLNEGEDQSPAKTELPAEHRDAGTRGKRRRREAMPEPALVREVHKHVVREDVMEPLQALLGRLESESWNGAIQGEIMQALTDKRVKVLTVAAKGVLSIWAAKWKNDVLQSWLEQAREDVEVFRWTERYAEPAPPARPNCESAYAVFHDLDEMIGGIPQAMIRDPLRAKVNALRDAFARQDKAHKQEMLNRVDGVHAEISKLHSQMAELRQMDGVRLVGAADDTRDEAAEESNKGKSTKQKKKKKKKNKEEAMGGLNAGRKRKHQEMSEEQIEGEGLTDCTTPLCLC